MIITGLSPEDCIIKIQSISTDIDKICDLFDANGLVKQEDLDEVRGRLHALKRLLKNEYEARDKVSSRKSMSSFEIAFFFPAIQEAFTSIHVKSNSLPSGKWLMELRDAQSSLNYYLPELQKIDDISA